MKELMYVSRNFSRSESFQHGFSQSQFALEVSANFSEKFVGILKEDDQVTVLFTCELLSADDSLLLDLISRHIPITDPTL